MIGKKLFQLPLQKWSKLLSVLIFICISSQSHACIPSCEIEAAFSLTVEDDNLIFEALDPNIPGATYSWQWDFGNGNDGGLEGETSVTFPIPPFPTTLLIRLGVSTDEFSKRCTKNVIIDEDCTQAGFSTNTNGCLANFMEIPNANTISQTWDFGDGSPESNESNPVHEYANSGTFNVCHALVWEDFNDCFTWHVNFCCEEVVIDCSSPVFTADFTEMEVEDCCKLQICFSSEFQDGIHFWDFGDGNTSTEVNP